MCYFTINKTLILGRKALYIVCSIILTVLPFALSSCGENENDHIRSGNKLYADSTFDKAQVEYQKALEKNPKSAVALYNMGNAQKNQKIMDKAYDSYSKASQTETNESRLAMAYHNMGVVKQDSQKFEEAIDNYKKSLRINPHDDETRYNLVLCQHQLQKQQQQNQQNQQNKDDKNKDKNKQNQNQQNQQNKDNKDNKDKNKDQQKDQQNQQQQQKQDPNQMSKQNAEQLLNAVMQKEKDTQEQVKKAQQANASKRQLEKQW